MSPLTKKCQLGHAGVTVDEWHCAEASMEARKAAVATIKLDVAGDEMVGDDEHDEAAE